MESSKRQKLGNKVDIQSVSNDSLNIVFSYLEKTKEILKLRKVSKAFNNAVNYSIGLLCATKNEEKKDEEKKDEEKKDEEKKDKKRKSVRNLEIVFEDCDDKLYVEGSDKKVTHLCRKVELIRRYKSVDFTVYVRNLNAFKKFTEELSRTAKTSNEKIPSNIKVLDFASREAIKLNENQLKSLIISNFEIEEIRAQDCKLFINSQKWDKFKNLKSIYVKKMQKNEYKNSISFFKCYSEQIKKFSNGVKRSTRCENVGSYFKELKNLEEFYGFPVEDGQLYTQNFPNLKKFFTQKSSSGAYCRLSKGHEVNLERITGFGTANILDEGYERRAIGNIISFGRGVIPKRNTLIVKEFKLGESETNIYAIINGRKAMQHGELLERYLYNTFECNINKIEVVDSEIKNIVTIKCKDDLSLFSLKQKRKYKVKHLFKKFKKEKEKFIIKKFLKKNREDYQNRILNDNFYKKS